MSDQYLDAFVEESKEEIRTLNNSLLALEADPDDAEAMDQIFRTAHTLKGNFAAMGFEAASELAHAIEDVLDEVRDGELAVTPEVMDLIFAGVDRIETIVGEIEADGETDAETGQLVAELREVLAGEDARTSDDAGREADESGESDEQVAAGTGGVRATIDLGNGEMLGVDAMLALEAIEESFAIRETTPDREAIEDGDFDEEFVVVVPPNDPEVVETQVGEIGQVEHIQAERAGTAEPADSEHANEDDPETTDETDPGAGTTSDTDGPEETDSEDGETTTAETETKTDEISSVRVDVDQLDDLHGLVEQLVTSRIKLRRAVENEAVDTAEDTLDELDKVSASLQNTVMDMRLVPMRRVVGKFPRMVRDLSRELDKRVEFTIEGETVELDRTILTEISDPLLHLLRNAVDHGIEHPERREQAGKPPVGSLELRARRERDHVVVEVADDGAGLDPDEIRAQAIEQGVRSGEELEAMDDSAVYNLIFHPGFSTAEEVTDTSGRGVGMDVVKETVTRLDGSVNVESTPGEGTTVSLRLPVTMAIVKVLFVSVGEEEYGVPIKNVDEITATSGIERVDGREVVRHDGDLYPVIDLGEAFDVPTVSADGGAATTGVGERGGEGMLVRIRPSERQVALRCDAVETQEEVVVKPLEGMLSGTPGLSGTAVLGDGNIVHIVDVATL